MIVGLPWLEDYNLKINWDLRTMDFDTIQTKTTFGKILRRTFELSRMEVLTPKPRPTIEEILNEETEESDIRNLRSFLEKDDEEDEEQERIWIRAKK